MPLQKVDTSLEMTGEITKDLEKARLSWSLFEKYKHQEPGNMVLLKEENFNSVNFFSLKYRNSLSRLLLVFPIFPYNASLRPDLSINVKSISGCITWQFQPSICLILVQMYYLRLHSSYKLIK